MTIPIKILLSAVLPLTVMLIRYYFNKEYIKPWFIFVLLGISIGLALFINNTIILAAIVVFCFLLLSLFIYFYENKVIWVFERIYDFFKYTMSLIHYPDNKKIQSVFDKYKNQLGDFCWLDSDYELEFEKWRKKHKNRKAKPIVFLKVKPKPNLSWVAAVELNLLRDLKYIGFRPVIFIYDIPIDFVSDTVIRITSKVERDRIKKLTSNNIKSIVGFGAEIYFSSDFFSKEGHSRKLHDLMLGSLIGEFIEVYLNNQIPNSSSYDDNQEVRLRLLGYLSMVAAEILIEDNPAWIIQWEARVTKWTKSMIISKPPLILTRTIKVNGKHINQLQCVQISDSINETTNKLIQYSNLKTKNELIELCSFLRGDQFSKFEWKNCTINLEIDAIRSLVKSMYEKDFITIDKFHEVETIIQNSKSSNGIKHAIESDEDLEAAFLKLKALEIITTYKERFFV